jgi:hypothetical protein
MDGISAAGSSPAGPEGGVDEVQIALLKKTQDLAAQQSAALIASLPPPPSPNLPGMGGRIDVRA